MPARRPASTVQISFKKELSPCRFAEEYFLVPKKTCVRKESSVKCKQLHTSCEEKYFVLARRKAVRD